MARFSEALRLRPGARDDEAVVLNIADQRDLHDFRIAGLTRSLLVDNWRVTEFDPAADSRVVMAERAIIGYGAVFDEGAKAFVDPRREGEGAGAMLCSWLEARVRERGMPTVRQRVAGTNLSARAFLEAAGYTQVRSVLILHRSLNPLAAMQRPALPAGITLAPLDVERDAAALHAADDEAFALAADYTPTSLAAFRQEHLDAPEFEPGLSRIARRGEAVVGFVLCQRDVLSGGYVDLLAVATSERRRGLGTGLLREAFGAFERVGFTDAWLDVASDNPGARRIYERVGMTVRHSFAVYEKPAA